MNVRTDSIFKQNYDVIIVGGGPAGSTAAQFSAKSGAKVLLLERDPVLGSPVRCGEGVSERGIKGYISLKGPWIANKLNSLELFSPDNSKIELTANLIGYILDRSIFDKVLGEKAEIAGASIVTNADVKGLLKSNGHLDGVLVQYEDKEYEVRGKIIIGADGVESRVGRWHGIKTMTKMNNMESGIQINATNINIKRDVCQFYFGHEVAPGGYLWVFPKSDNQANIGLAVSGNYSRQKPAKDYLMDFMNKRFPHAEWSTMVAGGIPCNPPLKQLTKSNLLLAGDAGHQVNPLTGAGIANAIQAGRLAGETAGNALKSGGSLEQNLKIYEKKWRRSRGRFHKSATRLKNAVHGFDDDKLNELSRMLIKIPKNDWSMLRIFLFAVRKNPELIIDCIKLFKKF